MLLKKPTIAICSSSNLQSTLALPASLTPPWISTRRDPRHQSARPPQCSSSRRSYATVHHHERPEGSGKRTHRIAWPSGPHPTPYEIFGLAKSAPYSKATYFELAKLYHPDHHHNSMDDGISRGTKLERYRLIVAANDILSDPAKRRLYDLYGAGWAGVSDMQNGMSREADRAWRQEPGSASMNATWEDWERWYQRRDGKEKQQPLYMSNGSFVFVVLFFIMVASWGQATRAGSNSLTLIEMRDRRHNAISQGMRHRQLDSAELTREGRVESFLRQREVGATEQYSSHGQVPQGTTSK